MFFGISYGEILVILGAGALVFGARSCHVRDPELLAKTVSVATEWLTELLEQAQKTCRFWLDRQVC